MSKPPTRSQNFCRGKSKVKFNFRTVRTRVIPILKRVEIGDSPAKMGHIYGWSKQHVCYYLDKLQKAGLVCRRSRNSTVFYELTGLGQNFLVSCEVWFLDLEFGVCIGFRLGIGL